MKNSFKTIALFAALLFTVSACADWTKQESIGFEYQTFEDKNPDLYKQYLEAIRQYHKTDHPVLIAKFDNAPGRASICAEKLDCLPDSVDMVILNNSDNIHPSTLEEAKSIRKSKGIKTLAYISLENLVKEYGNWCEAEGETYSDADCVDWVEDHVTKLIHNVRSNDLDGVVFSYIGRSTIPMKTAEKAQYLALQNAFFESAAAYKESHASKLFIFEGTPKYLVDDEYDILDLADYIIFPTESATGTPTFSYLVENSIDAKSPVEKYIISAHAINDVDDLSTEGIFSDGSSAIIGAALWVNLPSARYEKAGICVNHAQRDYYGLNKNYADIRSAISIMNPSPIK